MDWFDLMPGDVIKFINDCCGVLADHEINKEYIFGHIINCPCGRDFKLHINDVGDFYLPNKCLGHMKEYVEIISLIED